MPSSQPPKGQSNKAEQANRRHREFKTLRCASLLKTVLRFKSTLPDQRSDMRLRPFADRCRSGQPAPEIDFAASEARNTASCAMSFGSIMALIDAAATRIGLHIVQRPAADLRATLKDADNALALDRTPGQWHSRGSPTSPSSIAKVFVSPITPRVRRSVGAAIGKP